MYSTDQVPKLFEIINCLALSGPKLRQLFLSRFHRHLVQKSLLKFEVCQPKYTNINTFIILFKKVRVGKYKRLLLLLNLNCDAQFRYQHLLRSQLHRTTPTKSVRLRFSEAARSVLEGKQFLPINKQKSIWSPRKITYPVSAIWRQLELGNCKRSDNANCKLCRIWRHDLL